MEIKELTKEKNWVIVKEKNVFNYDTYNEAIVVNTMIGGHLMSRHYYENHYKKEHES